MYGLLRNAHVNPPSEDTWKKVRGRISDKYIHGPDAGHGGLVGMLRPPVLPGGGEGVLLDGGLLSPPSPVNSKAISSCKLNLTRIS